MSQSCVIVVRKNHKIWGYNFVVAYPAMHVQFAVKIQPVLWRIIHTL